ncbi:MAG: hypothetical protein A2289_04355 [Deltaproteobacteria bacterium RIFOXYA12_FULL_58_15]|nr:MAG: hypothetical protein A2289_04355 [Deltaproteobacteria bacterium RIFOXYA12_FULL_58_15]OGR10393.1 MAG: hypothetical protein A2341_23015 [Deltaproteobacteria bacterium RIFOXYB12_FULL_58_9]
MSGESLPEFDVAVDRLLAFVVEHISTTGPPLFVFKGDRLEMSGGPYVRSPLPENGEHDARRIYDEVRQRDGGLALCCVGVLAGRPVVTVEHTDDEPEAEYLMLPERGLKLSVAQPLRPMRPVRWRLLWWFLRRKARRMGADSDVSVARRI